MLCGETSVTPMCRDFGDTVAGLRGKAPLVSWSGGAAPRPPALPRRWVISSLVHRGRTSNLDRRQGASLASLGRFATPCRRSRTKVRSWTARPRRCQRRAERLMLAGWVDGQRAHKGWAVEDGDPLAVADGGETVSSPAAAHGDGEAADVEHAVSVDASLA